jgi:hypothetical protein
LEAFIQKHGHVTEEYKFYNGTITLRFNKEDWRYFRVAELGNLLPVNGITNVVGIIDKSHMLTPWAAKMAIQKLLRIMPTEMVEGIIRIKPLTFEEFTVIALESKGAHKEKLDEACDIGHIAHKCLEDSINFALANDPEKIVRQLLNVPTDELAANAALSGFNWMQAHNVRWLETESKVYSLEHNYAGTMDGLCICDSCNDKACCPEVFKDRLSLCDWKSSNYLKIEYLFQTAAYRHAKQEEFPEIKIIDTWILRLGKNEEEAGKFEPWHMTADEYEEDFNGYLTCLRLTRLVDSVEERMKSQKRTIRAVKKEQRETAKALKKEQEKLQKAIDKAAAKVVREAEKARIKAEAKAERERLKAEKKAGVLQVVCDTTVKAFAEFVDNLDANGLPKGIQPTTDDVVFTGGSQCTSTSSPVPVSQLASTDPAPITGEHAEKMDGPQSPTTPAPETPQLESTTSTVETMTLSPADLHVVVEALVNPPAPNEALKAAFIRYETEVQFTPVKLPMEG